MLWLNSNEPVAIAANPSIVIAPTTASSIRDMIITGMFMLMMLFAVYPITAPRIAARITVTIGDAMPNLVPTIMAIAPEPNAIIPADGTPVPRP